VAASRRSLAGHRALLPALAAALFAAGCGDTPTMRLLAFSDEIATSCAPLAGQMVEGWQSSEEARQRQLTYEQADLRHLDTSRARCAGALRLLDELGREHRSLPAEHETTLQGLLILDRLLLRTIEEPRMDSATFLLTTEEYLVRYMAFRPRLRSVVRLSAADQKRIVGELLPRWRELTPGSGAAGAG
jgi:hypothetical protein